MTTSNSTSVNPGRDARRMWTRLFVVGQNVAAGPDPPGAAEDGILAGVRSGRNKEL